MNISEKTMRIFQKPLKPSQKGKLIYIKFAKKYILLKNLNKYWKK